MNPETRAALAGCSIATLTMQLLERGCARPRCAV